MNRAHLLIRLLKLITAGYVLAQAAALPAAPIDLAAWMQNTTGQTGHSTDPVVNAAVDTITADVRQVWYTNTNVYIRSAGVPSYNVGPFPGDPAVPSDRNWLFSIPRNAQTAAPGTNTPTPLGQIGVLVNGVPIFNPKDANSYQNQNVWHNNAVVVEASSFDSALGHPAPVMGAIGNPLPGIYHDHQLSPALMAQLGGFDATKPSPIIGYAFDGHPIYGPYGFANPDGSGGVVRMTSSYQLVSTAQRHSIGGSALTQAQWGPDVGAQYPLGSFIEDYQYVQGLGLLDQFNGRFTVTPDYPQGTYAYFATIGPDGLNAFPYLLGPSYQGVVDASNFNQTATIPGSAVQFLPTPEPGSFALLALGGIGWLRRRQAMARPRRSGPRN